MAGAGRERTADKCLRRERRRSEISSQRGYSCRIDRRPNERTPSRHDVSCLISILRARRLFSSAPSDSHVRCVCSQCMSPGEFDERAFVTRCITIITMPSLRTDQARVPAGGPPIPVGPLDVPFPSRALIYRHSLFCPTPTTDHPTKRIIHATPIYYPS